FAVRQLRRHPGFALTTIVTLALAIGANTAIFSIVNALMLKNLPYQQPERIGTLFRLVKGGQPFDGRHSIDGLNWERLRDNVPSLISAVSSRGATGVNLEASRSVQYIQYGRISAHYLDVLGIQPALGRNFTAAEDLRHGPKSAILSYNLWHTAFHDDRSLIGQSVRLKGEPYTIIGVLSQNATTPLNASLYTALQPSRDHEGEGTNYDAIVRLQPNATWQQANAELNRAWSDWGTTLAPQYGPGAKVSFYTVPLQKGQSAKLRPKALGLMFSAGFILLIACANLAGLTLVRVTQRTSEMATRLALGASRWQLQRQLWIENLLLAAIGGLIGIAVGYTALRGLLSLLPENYLPVSQVPLDLRVLTFTLVLSLLTSILFGMIPTLAVRKVDLRSSMATRGATSEGLRLRQALIAGEVALTVLLLAGSGLLIRTLVHLETLPPGFNASGVMTAKASLDDARYHDPVAFHKLLTESTAAMRRIPGVQSAAVGLTLPYEQFLNDQVKLHDGPYANQQVGSDFNYVTPDYFQALQTPILAGRSFTDSDGPNSQSVAIVNQAFAQKFFHGESAIGKTLDDGTLIVGMVSNVQLVSGLDSAAPIQSEETIYVPAAQWVDRISLALLHTWYQPSWIVRTAAPVSGLTEQMQHALADVDPGLPFSGFYSMNDLLAKSLADQRIEVALLSAMAGLALLLSAVGIFALVANMVAQRTREIGIRIALGSSIRRAILHVGRSGVLASASGLVLGLLLCAGVLRVMRSVLYGVGVYDGVTLATVVLALAGITVVATLIPALHIARINPVDTLRDE
ncbi:ABC transporter permease, partial [Terracidiphilus sp.]|uniref:ABC transporter permease n=1 Tax=Terracidiphilus sp. TaxID=1964191 RepID=UPI003C23C968